MAFERLVRADLEKKGWIVAKWTNNVEIIESFPEARLTKMGKIALVNFTGIGFTSTKLVPAKHKFNPFKKVMGLGTGFPDFIAFRQESQIRKSIALTYMDAKYSVIGVESKMKGHLDKLEKEKCKWLLENGIFFKILIAKKGKKRGEIIYDEFKP